MNYRFSRTPVAFFVTLLLSCGGPKDFGTKVIPAAPAVGEWSEVGAAVLDDSASLEYRIAKTKRGEQVIAVLDHRRRIKILGENGLSQATVELRTDGFSTVTNIRARSVSPSGDVLELDTRSIRTQPWPGERQRDKKLNVVAFGVPGAKVGGVIEYRYERVYLNADFVEPWALGGRLPRVRSQLDIVVPPELRIEYRTGERSELTDEAPLRRKLENGGERLVFVKKDVPPYYLEPRMVHPLRLVPWVASVIVEANL
ncbi:MAG: DUF3857 domain-containing protein, partial [Myxococcota bacterium]